MCEALDALNKPETYKTDKTDKMLCEMKRISGLTDERLVLLVPQGDELTKKVSEAAAYSLSAGGKHLRAVLMWKFCEMCGGRITRELVDVFCTIELIHTFSLIHDDLPCMDNDDYRRGKLSCHKVFGEAVALLAGDALEALAFEIIAKKAAEGCVTCEQAVELITILGNAVGINGMIGGQTIDMLSENAKLDEAVLSELQKKKTGALIAAACKMGCVIANADESELAAAERYAEYLGLAFQIRDDILDVTGSFEQLGKPIGSDMDKGKATYVSLLGVEASEKLCAELTEKAVAALSCFNDSRFLSELALYLVDRRS